ncbi:hypothetical protein GCM10010310_22090 [Streptomyces violaceolatus]|uniref:Uncharacterized protein n=1 Tax=Streptomyces violaceolatus TaxID=67378 RepID=A0ABN3SHK4_9ACTN
MTKTATPDHRPGETCEHAARPAGPEVPRTAPDRSRPGPVAAPRTRVANAPLVAAARPGRPVTEDRPGPGR